MENHQRHIKPDKLTLQESTISGSLIPSISLPTNPILLINRVIYSSINSCKVRPVFSYLRLAFNGSFIPIHEKENATGTDEKTQHPHTYDIDQCLKYVFKSRTI